MSYSTYQNIKIEIDMYKKRKESLEREELYLQKAHSPKELTGVDYSDDFISGSPLDTAYIMNRLAEIRAEITWLEKIINEKENIKKEIENFLGRLEGLDYKVCYYREIRGMGLKGIAEKLGYSQAYIKEISSRNKITYQKPTDN